MTRAMRNQETLVQALADFFSGVQAYDRLDIDEYRYYSSCLEADKYQGYEDEDEQWERETYEWLRNHSGNPEDENYSEIYSDIYKDLHGFRPRREDGTVIW